MCIVAVKNFFISSQKNMPTIFQAMHLTSQGTHIFAICTWEWELRDLFREWPEGSDSVIHYTLPSWPPPNIYRAISDSAGQATDQFFPFIHSCTQRHIPTDTRSRSINPCPSSAHVGIFIRSFIIRFPSINIAAALFRRQLADNPTFWAYINRRDLVRGTEVVLFNWIVLFMGV
jgi:hypothetical protein